MRWKQSLTPLSEVPDLDSDTAERLTEHHITTAEELVGQIDAEPAGVAELLGVGEPDVHELARRAREVIGSDVAEAMDSQRDREYGLGALPPDDAE
jgi:hypothetical protein